MSIFDKKRVGRKFGNEVDRELWSSLRRRIAGVTLLFAALSSTYAEPTARTYNTPLDEHNLRNTTASNLFSGMTSRIESRVNNPRHHTTVISRHKTIDDTRPGGEYASAYKSRLTFRQLSAQAAGTRPHTKAQSERSHQQGPQGRISSAGNYKRASPKQEPDSDAISKLPKVGMFYHIPKTGGSSIREAMTPEYEKRFPWGATFSYPRCGVKRASTFHLTPDDMAKCGVLPLPGLSLCVIRDPIARFASEVRWRASFRNGWLGEDPRLFAARMAVECEAARRYIKADVFCHCQPQVNYLYRGAAQRAEEEAVKEKPARQVAVSSSTSTSTTAGGAPDATRTEHQVPESGPTRAQGEGSSVNKPERPPLVPACDYVLADPSAHTRLLRHLLPRKLPPERVNVSENKTDTAMLWPGLNEREKAWVRSFYARDFADPVIGLASQGAVLRHDKAMGKYVEIKGLGRREAEQARATEMKGGPRNPPSSRSEVGQERNAKGKGHHG